MTMWITPTAKAAAVWKLPAVPLPVSEAIAAMFEGDRVEPSAVALDVDSWLLAEERPASATAVLGRYVATLAYIGALELLDRGRPDAAARLLEVGVRRLPGDPSLRANLGMALWDSGRRLDGLAQMVLATHQYRDAGQIAPVLWLLTARALSEAGRHADALELLEMLDALGGQPPYVLHLIDTIEDRLEAS